MGKDSYAVMLYFYFSDFGERCNVELCYNTERHFRKYCNKENNYDFQSLKYYFSQSNAGNENVLSWHCKELGGYDGDIPEKYFCEILSEVKKPPFGRKCTRRKIRQKYSVFCNG